MSRPALVDANPMIERLQLMSRLGMAGETVIYRTYSAQEIRSLVRTLKHHRIEAKTKENGTVLVVTIP